jgi:hypothetical protein
MTLKLEHFGSPRNDQAYIADRNLYLDAEGNLVEEDDPAQVRQLIGKGGALSTEVAEKYGLLKKSKAKQAEETTEAATEGTDGEQASAPSAKKKTRGAKK